MYLQRGKKSADAQSQSSAGSTQLHSQNTKSPAEMPSKNTASAAGGIDKCDIFTPFNITHLGKTFSHHLCIFHATDMAKY